MPLCIGYVYRYGIGGREFQDSSCFVQPIAIGYCTSAPNSGWLPLVYRSCRYSSDWFCLCCGGVTSYVCNLRLATIWQSPKPPQQNMPPCDANNDIFCPFSCIYRRSAIKADMDVDNSKYYVYLDTM